ncbi:hypothetical protein EHQ23_19660 [Leptospira bourretii]|uniref:Uncharacterized protein n=1 Tax=Leptospira bourretii TaxID=2484962 RepID=A0A4R9IQV2_9LEPT|nr:MULTISPECIES: hypothetical protein [Leptospira]TGK79271.1 hypothetical protein EHQ23_19660 [Leptospira bourretii]TGK94386.1 hypothetical protein EHQ26_03370 [Leptospira bourretii]TGL16807.1 hypothetical protein EHQ42_10775 [Leptospira levettii]TGL38864.1 hypothetical protein EHQ45_04660 [Leptospira bourretii]
MNKDWQKQFMGLVSSFTKSSTGAEDTPPPPSADDGGTGAGEGISDEFLDKLKSAIESGEVAVEESAIKAYCKTNGISEEDSAEIWGIISEGLSDEGGEEPAPEPDPGSDIQKGGNKAMDPDFVAFAKSTAMAVKSAETHEMAIASLIEENAVFAKENQEIKKEIAFLKSELGKVLKQPVDSKKPVLDTSGIPAQYGRAEIIQLISKGVQDKKLALGDLQTFKSSGRQTEAVVEFLKSSSKGGN